MKTVRTLQRKRTPVETPPVCPGCREIMTDANGSRLSIPIATQWVHGIHRTYYSYCCTNCNTPAITVWVEG